MFLYVQNTNPPNEFSFSLQWLVSKGPECVNDGIVWDTFLQGLISSLATKRLYPYAIDAALLWLSISRTPTLDHIKYVLKFAIDRKSEVR